MKRKLSLLFCLLLFTSLFITSCTKEEVLQDTTQLTQGSDWHVTQFSDDGKDETSHFSGYTFTFMEDGKIIAKLNNNIQYTGNWYISSEDLFDDNPSSNSKELIITFSQSILEELNEDWTILESKEKLLSLEHISGGNGGTDKLILER